MKRRNRIFAAAAGMVLLTAGCAPEREAASTSASAPAAAEIRWILAMEGASYSKAWESYEVLEAITEETGVTPVLEPLTDNIAPTLLKRLQSGERPALITLYAADPTILQMKHVASVRPINTIPDLLDRLPEPVRAFHQEADGTLLYLPGGFGGDATVPAEGVYMRQDMFDTLGRPGVTDTESFFNALDAYASWYVRNRDETRAHYQPVVFGPRGDIQTLRHLFGLTPGEENPAGEEALLRFLERLGRAGVSPDSLSLTDTGLDSVLQSEALIYIGSADRIERYNREHPETAYFPVWPFFHPDGYLMAASVYGSYATYLCAADAVLPDTIRLASYMLSEEGSRTALLGLRDRHWLEKDDGGLVLFPDSRSQILSAAAYMEETGIGRVPFLSSVGAVYPGLRSSRLPVRDILAACRQAQYDPTTEQGLLRSQQEDRRLQSYKNALALGAAD